MATTISSVEKIGTKTYRYNWTDPGGASYYHVHIAGAAPVYTELLTYTISSSDALEPPPVEIIADVDTNEALNVTHPSTAVIQWRGDTEADRYKVQEKVASVWTTRRQIRETTEGYYKYETAALADVTTHNWQVIPLDSEGTEGNPLTIDVVMVRHPPVPSISGSYAVGTGNLTISAR